MGPALGVRHGQDPDGDALLPQEVAAQGFYLRAVLKGEQAGAIRHDPDLRPARLRQGERGSDQKQHVQRKYPHDLIALHHAKGWSMAGLGSVKNFGPFSVM